ncbi:MAG: DUF4143 domain-containing protein, partial [Leptospira sp.]|nr:DUF4143 domain-containing protein [Leptospira sp.]
SPWTVNASKRLVRSPKLYFRDSGILHQLLGIQSYTDLLNSPHCGDSWEGFVVEQILAKIPKSTLSSFYRSSTGNEIDLVLETNRRQTLAIEIKLSPNPKLSPGFYKACEDIGTTQKYVIVPGEEDSKIAKDMWIMGLRNFLERIGKQL